jgi:histone deacetylase complex regulatory component SIN3
LQTYQRESKPIQDVYAQVTHLFAVAPDLLENFKIFLSKSAIQARWHAQHSLIETERYGRAELQAPIDDRRRKRARYYLTDSEDEVLTHHAARVAKRIPDLEPYEADDEDEVLTHHATRVVKRIPDFKLYKADNGNV